MTTINSASGNPVGVTDGNRGMQQSVMRDYHLACLLEGWAFTAYDDAVTPSAGSDVFAKLQNASNDLMYVTGIRLYDAGAELVHVQLSPAYSSATSHADIAPVNRYVGSANLAGTKGVFESDVDITGDTGVTVRTLQIAATTQQDYDLSDSPIIVGVNQALILEAATGGNAIRWEADFFFGVVPIIDA